jgi:hypothetical protein
MRSARAGRPIFPRDPAEFDEFSDDARNAAPTANLCTAGDRFFPRFSSTAGRIPPL